jgi:2-iminobutanoate/2-iminopropanoate deaminase
MKKDTIHTDSAPAAIGPYVQAIQVGSLIYTAGQAGLDPITSQLAEGGVEAQAVQTMNNLKNVLEAAGTDFDHVIKTSIYLRYIKDFEVVNDVYASYFNGEYPARTTMAVSALPKAALVEIEMIAIKAETEEKLQGSNATEVAKVRKKQQKGNLSEGKKRKKKKKKLSNKKKKSKK